MTIHPGKPKCCKRIVEVTFPPNPNDPATVDNGENVTQDTLDKVRDDIKNNPDEWRLTGPDSEGNVTATRPAEFCGDELKKFLNDPPGNPNNLSGSPDWDYA